MGEILARLAHRGAHPGDDLDGRFEQLVFDPRMLPIGIGRGQFGEDVRCLAHQTTLLDIDEAEFEFDAEAGGRRGVEVQGHRSRVSASANVRAMSEGIETGTVVSGRAGPLSSPADPRPRSPQPHHCCGPAGTRWMPRSPGCSPQPWPSRSCPASAVVASACMRAPGQPPEYLDFFVDTPGLGRAESAAAPMTSVRIVFGRPDDPQAEQVFHAGWSSVAVPGCFTGYLDAHSRWGSLPMAQVVAPAIRLARDGIVLDPIQLDFLRLVADVLAVTPDSAALYAPAMRGAPFRNPGYADLLEAIADGATMSIGCLRFPAAGCHVEQRRTRSPQMTSTPMRRDCDSR